jgi:N-acetylglucosamine-6-sulfatase
MWKLTRRSFLSATAVPALSGGAAASRRPNVVYLITDDQRWDLMSLRGHPFVRTPNMDRIGREGALFLNSFVTTSLCSPSRASYLTGRYAHQHKVQYNRVSATFDKEERTFPRLLHDAGYRTGYVGKWHIGNDASPRPGFDYWAVLPGQGVYRNPTFNINGQVVNREGHVDRIVGELAAGFVSGSSADKPFCLCVGIKSPHAEQLPPAEMMSLLDGVEVPKPPTWYEDYSQSGKADVVANSCIEADRFFDGPRQLKGGWDRYIKDFYRSVMSADQAVGMVLEALDRKNLTADTLVIFVGDNGFFLGEHRLVDKRFPYEEALRVPALIRYPRFVPAARTVTGMALNIDICPTILDFCGVPVPGDIAGRSLRPLLQDGAARPAWRQDFFYEYAERIWQCPALVAVRTGRHKYIEYLDAASTNELYDLLVDPLEMRNLIRDPGYAGVLGDMQRRLARLKKETGWKPPVATGPNSPCPGREKPVQ